MQEEEVSQRNYWTFYGSTRYAKIRSSLFFGVEIEKEAIAFSQPTDMGQKLALRYFNRKDYKIYMWVSQKKTVDEFG